jgi:hypothetical protein
MRTATRRKGSMTFESNPAVLSYMARFRARHARALQIGAPVAAIIGALLIDDVLGAWSLIALASIGAYIVIIVGLQTGRSRAARTALVVSAAVVLGFLLAIVIQRIATNANPSGERWLGDRGLLAPVQPRSATGSNITITDSLRPHVQSVWVDAQDQGLVIDPTPVTCHGGRLHVEWHVGNLEPQSADAGIHLTARFNGEPVGTIMRGSLRGIWEDDPADLHAVIDCPSGDHVVDLVVNPSGKYGIPYAVTFGDPDLADEVVLRGFVLTEVWE